jgi:VanZ family protein
VKNRINKLIFYWLPVVVWAAVIFKISNGKIPLASSVYWQDFAIKKMAHVTFFGFLAILIYRALRGEGFTREKAAVWAILMTIFYGGTDELHQFFTQGRESRVRDVGFDTIGAAAAIYFVYKILPKLPQNIKEIFERMEIT